MGGEAPVGRAAAAISQRPAPAALTLAGLNTYMGQTTVTEGTLNIPTNCNIARPAAASRSPAGR